MIKGNKKIIVQSFLYNIKYILWVALTCLVSTYIFSTYYIVQETNYYSEIENVKDDYGSYTYKILGLEDDGLEIVASDKDTNSYLCVKVKSIQFNNEWYDYISASEDFFEYSNYCIVEGEYPQNENEVMVPKWYLYQLGISAENMIGSEIDIVNPDTNDVETKKVSGLVVINDDNTISLGTENSAFFIFGCEYVVFEDSLSNVYTITKNMNYNEEKLIKLTNHIYRVTGKSVDYELNYSLLNAYGYTENGKIIRKKQEYIYLFVVFLIGILLGLLLNNLITVCLIKWKNILRVYKLIGADMRQIEYTMICLFSLIIIISLFCGILMSIGSIRVFMRFVDGVKGVVPFKWLVIECLLELSIAAVLLNIKFKTYLINAAEHCVLNRGYNRNIENFSKKMLFESVRMGIVKLSFRNFSFYVSA